MAANLRGSERLLQTHYRQFSQAALPPFTKAEAAWCGTVVPFDSPDQILNIYSDLKNDRIVGIQEGSLRHIGGKEAVNGDPNLPYLVNMQIRFKVLVLEFAGGRHPEVYSVDPEISRQRFPLHPHLRDDLSLLLRGRYFQALCTDYAPDRACASIVDLLDFASIFLAKHLVWVRTRRLVDRAQGRIVMVPELGQSILETDAPYRGPEFNILAARFQNAFPCPFQERFGWDGYWPGEVAPHDYASNLKLADDAPCPCGSGQLYYMCHKNLDLENQRHLAALAYGFFEPKRAA